MHGGYACGIWGLAVTMIVIRLFFMIQRPTPGTLILWPFVIAMY